MMRNKLEITQETPEEQAQRRVLQHPVKKKLLFWLATGREDPNAVISEYNVHNSWPDYLRHKGGWNKLPNDTLLQMHKAGFLVNAESAHAGLYLLTTLGVTAAEGIREELAKPGNELLGPPEHNLSMLSDSCLVDPTRRKPFWKRDKIQRHPGADGWPKNNR